MPITSLKKSSVFIMVFLIIIAYSVFARLYSNKHTELPRINIGSTQQSQKVITGMEVDSDSPTSFEHTEYGFTFNSPDGWEFFDVGLPQQGSKLIGSSEDLPIVIYLFNLQSDSVMDLHVTTDVGDLSQTAFEEYTTTSGYSALLHPGDCSEFDEPKVILTNDDERQLAVEVDELCEEEEWKNKNLSPLVKELANSFTFSNR